MCGVCFNDETVSGKDYKKDWKIDQTRQTELRQVPHFDFHVNVFIAAKLSKL